MTPRARIAGKLKLLDLFSGIGGFSLGLERTGGFDTVAFCEIAEYPRKVLAQHWPDVPIYEDIRTLTAESLSRDGIAVDVICGGFPCQDISSAGKGAGLAGERSGLWFEYARLIGELRPRYVIVENVSMLLGRGLARVLGDLAALGYDAEWHAIPACYVGAPHRRDRVWIVAYSDVSRSQGWFGRFVRQCAGEWIARPSNPYVANPTSSERKRRRAIKGRKPNGPTNGGEDLGNTNGASAHAHASESGSWGAVSKPGWWLSEPDVGRVANGVPSRVDRLKGLGNAVVPQIPEMIGWAILEAAE